MTRLRRSEVTPGVGLVGTLAKLGQLQAEGAQLGDVVVELVHAALDGLHLVEFTRVLRDVGSAKALEFEGLPEFGHRCAQSQHVTAYVADTVADLRLEQAAAIGILRTRVLNASRSRAEEDREPHIGLCAQCSAQALEQPPMVA